MHDYQSLVRRDRRWAILAFLTECALYTSNGDVLLTVLNNTGYPSTRDEMVTELWWLREQGFLGIADHGDFLVVEATERGVELARGTARHPEVSRPRPGR